MTAIIICGTRRESDPDLLAAVGVNAMGLITEVYQAIPCNLSRDRARALARLAPPSLKSVLVVTAENLDEACRLAEHVAPDVLQLHGFNSPEDLAAIRARTGTRVVKTLHARGDRLAEPAGSIAEYLEAGASGILLDSYGGGKVGATGEVMSLDLARRIRDRIFPVPLTLAGGLNPGNVARAIERVGPHGVDAFSGVTTDGYLDAAKVERFVASVRARKEVSTVG